MLDTKVLAAVLVSLAATSIAVNGGASNPLENGLNFDSVKDVELSPRSLGAFTGLVNRPEPDTDVQATLNFNGSLPQEVRLRSATVKPENLTSIKAGDRSIDSGSSLTIYGFKGTLTLDRPLTVDGQAKGVVSNGVNVSGNFDINEQVETDSLELSDIKGSSFNLETVSGQISSGSTSAEISDGKLSMRSFTGNMSFNLERSSMNMSGKVGSLNAGSFSLD